MTFRVIALIAAFNEEDVIGQVVGDLIAQDVQVYLIDHGSTDATVDEARPHLGRGLLRIERFPDESGFPPDEAGHFAWTSILRRKEQLARELDASWFLHHDADELRESPWDGVDLAEGIRRVDALGYSAIDFKVLDFVPTSDGHRKGDALRASFRHYRPGGRHDRLQVKCWKKQPGGVDLASQGGHDVTFPGRRVFPVRFLLRHYPIRGQAHGERKVLRERLPRFSADERAKGWHVQYDAVRAEGTSFIHDPAGLIEYDPDLVRAALLAENREAEALRAEVERLLAALAAREQELSARQRERDAQQRERDAQASRAGSLEGERDALLRRVQDLERSLSWRLTGPLREGLRRLRGH